MRKYTDRDDARALHYPRSARDGGTTIPRMLRAAGHPRADLVVATRSFGLLEGAPYHCGTLSLTAEQQGRILEKQKNQKSQTEVIFGYF